VSGKFRVEGQDSVDWKEMTVTLRRVADAAEESDDTGLLGAFAQGGESGALNEDGSLEIKDVAAGNYQVVVSSPAEKYRDWYTKSVLVAGREVADTGFAVSGETAVEVVVNAKGASIEGKVVDGNGKAAAEAFVVTVPSSGKLGRPDSYQTARTDESGHFSVRGLNPGEFVVVALESLHPDVRSSEFLEKYGARGVKVEVGEGEKKAVALTVVEDEGK
jgi:hypothetical protein